MDAMPLRCLLTMLILLPGLALAGEAGSLRRLALPPDAIAPELGHCYIATFDFGEQGDSDAPDGSGLVLLEDGVPLGPAHSVHADIRAHGGGRYSHWQRTRLYFSASDGSDPRTNERLYEVASTNPLSLLPGLPELPSTPREHVEDVTAGRHEYTVAMGGTLDMENTRLVSTATCRVGYQPNVELVIANAGDTPVINPRLVLNDRGDWGSLEALVAEWTRGARDDGEKAMLLWQNMRHHTYHLEPLFSCDYPHDPVRLFNVLGFSLCDDAGAAGNALFLAAGLAGSTCRALGGHVQCEAMVDGRPRFLDADLDCFYLDRENERPVGGDELARDHDLVRRELNHGPVAGHYRTSEGLAALFGADDVPLVVDVRGHRLDYVLRPGEQVVFRWDHVGKYAARDSIHARRPPYFGNSRFEYVPRLATATLDADGARHSGWGDAPGGGLRSGPQGARLELDVQVPWLVCGGRVEFELAGGARAAGCALEVRAGERPWRTVWESAGPGDLRAVVPLDDVLEPRNSPPLEGYHLRLAVRGPGVELRALRLVTDIMAAPLSLPRLQLGDNRAVYRDDTPGPRRVTITHRWRETDALVPPPPPGLPLSPANAAAVAADRVTYAWPAVPGARRYRLQVSLRPDFAWPYRPGLDVAIPDTTWTVPFEGIYSPGVTYYWRVRTMGERGAWGPWSGTWTFTWDGPRVPVDLAFAAGDGRIRLDWRPNPRGPRPVAYEVYGSGIRGFTIAREDHDELGLGRLPANLLARTEGTSLEVVAPGLEGAAACEVFYRVVAIDSAGTRSGPSDYVELPHPYFFGEPPGQAIAGQEYRYRLRSLSSRGDLQQRAMADGSVDCSYSDGDRQRFELLKAPGWLEVDAETGEVSGTPAKRGRHRIVAEATTRHGGSARQEWEIEVLPAPAAATGGQ